MSLAGRIVYEAELDGLRAIAVLGVVSFHLGLPFMNGGFAGVDVFFVLSGYLITALIWPSIRTGEFSFVDFYVRRARRLLPALFVVIFVSSIVSWLLLSPTHLADFGRSAVHAVISLSNVSFWQETGYFDQGKYTKPLLHTWSLGVEEQFYLFWPFFLLMIAALRRPALQMIALASAILLSFTAGIKLMDQFPNAVFYLSPFRVWQFGAGGLLALALHRGAYGGRRWTLSPLPALLAGLSGLGLTGFSFIALEADTYPGWQALIPTIATLLVILAGATPMTTALLANPSARYLGRLSYSLYLTHWPIIVFWRYYTHAELNAFGLVACTLLSFASAVILHQYVERPLRRPWTTNAMADRLAVPAGTLSAMVILLLMSIFPWAQNGWTWRLDRETRQFVEGIKAEDDLDCLHYNIHGLGYQCFIGVGAVAPQVVILGDSHAEALGRGMETPLQWRGETALLLSSPGTLPFLGTVTYDNEQQRGTAFDQRLEWAASSDADVIILHARFALHWHGIRPEGEESDRIKLVGEVSQPPPDTIEQSQAFFLAGLDRTLARLRDSGKVVILVGAVPYQGVDLSHCAGRPSVLLPSENVEEDCAGFSRDDALARTREVNAVLEASALRHGAVWLDPSSILCPEEETSCLRTVGDRLVYRDDDHLSTHGAMIVAGAVFELIDGRRNSVAQSVIVSRPGTP